MHCIIARARPAEVSEPLIKPLLYKAAAACPSGTINTSLWPHLCIGLRGGTSVGWPLNRVQICIPDDTTLLPGSRMDASRLYVYFRCCQPPFGGGSWLRSYLHRHRSTMVVFCFDVVASSYFLYSKWSLAQHTDGHNGTPEICTLKQNSKQARAS